MATKVRYTGKGDRVIGRFGRVKRNQILSLNREEARYLKENPSPELKIVGRRTKHQAVGIYPKPTQEFDLPTIPWNENKLFRWLKKKSRYELHKVIKAMISIGVPVQNVVASTPHGALVDIIDTVAGEQGWLDMPDNWLQVSKEEEAMKKDKQANEEETKAVVDKEKSLRAKRNGKFAADKDAKVKHTL